MLRRCRYDVPWRHHSRDNPIPAIMRSFFLMGLLGAGFPTKG